MRGSFALLVAATTFAGCAKHDPIDTTAVSSFIDKQTAYVVDEVGYASNYPGALASYDQNAVRLIGAEAPELFTLVNAQWSGTLEDLARKVARSIGYGTAARGERLPHKTIAVVNSYNLPAIGLLRQGFAQGRGRVRLEVNTRTRTLTVVYARPERSPIPHQEDTTL